MLGKDASPFAPFSENSFARLQLWPAESLLDAKALRFRWVPALHPSWDVFSDYVPKKLRHFCL